jgi:hypothetical protein
MIGDGWQGACLIQSCRWYSLEPNICPSPEVAIRRQRKGARAGERKCPEMLAIETGQRAGPHGQPQESIARLHNIVNDVGRQSVVIMGEASVEIAAEGLTGIERNSLTRETGQEQQA